ncbi:MAG: hypothetical protein U0572_02180 [Phycisphaerales bacterium]
MRSPSPTLPWPFDRRVVTATVVVAALASPLPPAHGVTRPTQEVGAGGDGRLASDAAFFEAVLSDSAASFALRRSAADRLVRSASPEARRALEKALRSPGPGRRATVDALDRSGAGFPDLASAILDAALALWGDDSHEAHATAVRVLALSDSAAADDVATAALAPGSPTSRRLAGIGTLGELRTRAAAKQLIALLAEGRNESADTVAATCTALERCVGTPLGNDPAAWRRWWRESADANSIDDAQVRALAVRAAEAERSLADERRRAERLEARVVAAYEQLFLRLTQSERLERGADLLDDELVSVRTFAVGQLERMLRNGERADDGTRRQALVLLDDPVPALRIRGARLLNDLGVADLSSRLAERLPREQDLTVAAAFLGVMANRPQSETFVTLLPLIKEPALSEPACRVIAALADAKLLPTEWEALVLPAVREVVAARPNAAAVQLLAMAGEESDVQKATSLLDGPDASVRRGAAEGLRRRGVRRPILERAQDPALYAPVVAAIGDEPKTLDTLRLLINAPPPPDMLLDWNAAVARLLHEMTISDVVAADRLLANVQACELRTRAEGLSRIVAGARAGMPKAELEEGLARLVDVLVADGRGADAIDMLEDSAPKPGEPTFDALFRAQALTGNYPEAFKLVSDPKRWIDLLASLVKDPAAARPLADEIALRYGDVLSAEDRAAFEKLRRDLAPPNGAATLVAPASGSSR